MRKQISFFDSVRFIICSLIAFVIYSYVQSWGYSLLSSPESMGTVFLAFFCGTGLAALLSIALGLIVVSWRYKLIGGTLLLYMVIADRIIDIINSLEGLLQFLGSVTRLSFGLLGALGAIFIWQILTPERKEKFYKVSPDKVSKKRRKPKTSIILLILSLFSVPLTYVAMFVSAFVTLGLSALLLLIIMQLPRVPIFIIIAAVLAPLIAGWASLKALWVMFFPKIEFQPAVNLDINKYSTLKTVISKICKKVKTKKPNAIILHSEPTFFVMQGKLESFDGIVKGRILSLGMPLLRELDSSEVQSILAHEFAHFSGRDTLYSTLVSPVYRGIISSMNDLEGTAEGQSENNITSILMNLLLLPSRLFLRVFLNYFSTIDMVLSRSRELRADWIAANLFSKTTFINALTKVVKISQHFNETNESIALKCDDNFFEIYSKSLQKDQAKLQEYKTMVLAETQDELDSHPTLAIRLENLPEDEEVKTGFKNVFGEFKEEFLNEEKELSRKYTDWLKKLKEIYEQYLKMLNSLKYEK